MAEHFVSETLTTTSSGSTYKPVPPMTKTQIEIARRPCWVFEVEPTDAHKAFLTATGGRAQGRGSWA